MRALPNAAHTAASLNWNSTIAWGRALQLEHKLYTLQLVTQHNTRKLVAKGLQGWLASVHQEFTVQLRCQRLLTPKYQTMLAQALLPPDLARHAGRTLLPMAEISMALVMIVAVLHCATDSSTTALHAGIFASATLVDADPALLTCLKQARQGSQRCGFRDGVSGVAGSINGVVPHEFGR